MTDPHAQSPAGSSQRVPRHVAIIMDGNGRWARAKGLERSAGHAEGVNTVRRVTEAASRDKVEYLTLYTFSTENWRRPDSEVDMLMHLIATTIELQTPDLVANNVRLLTIGDTARMPAEARRRLQACMDRTSSCTGLTLVLALSYSSRWEVAQAVAAMAAEGLPADTITEQTITDHLSTTRQGIPEPDLVIRTGGEQRLSNFLLWQAAYAELYFTPRYWPDFNDQDWAEALEHYRQRERRYGLTGDQVRHTLPDGGCDGSPES